MRFTFVCELHEEYGTNGWRLKNKPGFDPAAGMQVAHDVLEEFPDGHDQPHDEFMALGAAIYVRNYGGFWAGKPNCRVPVEDHLSSDFPEIFRHVLYETGYSMSEPPSTKPLDDTEAERILQAIPEKVRRDLPHEFADELDEIDERWVDWAIDWMRIGFRKARRRYGQTQEYDLCWIFQEIEEKADKALLHAEIGDELRIDLVARRCWYEVTHV